MTTTEPQRRLVGYRFSSDDADDAAAAAAAASSSSSSVLWLAEDPALVLLGGECWPSAFAMAECLQRRLETGPDSDSAPPPAVIVELGAGAGLCGLVAAASILRRFASSSPPRCRVFLTDESPELAVINAERFREEWLSATRAGGDGASGGGVAVEALDLPWGGGGGGIDDLDLPPSLAAALRQQQGSSSLLVLGCEVTPMARTQPALVATLGTLLRSTAVARGDAAMALLTVDACVLQETRAYPRKCPAAAAAAAATGRGRGPCAGHRFLALIEAEGDLEWGVEHVWTVDEVHAACARRRVRRDGDAGGGPQAAADFGAVTAPEGLVLVAIIRRSSSKK